MGLSVSSVRCIHYRSTISSRMLLTPKASSRAFFMAAISLTPQEPSVTEPQVRWCTHLPEYKASLLLRHCSTHSERQMISPRRDVVNAIHLGNQCEGLRLRSFRASRSVELRQCC